MCSQGSDPSTKLPRWLWPLVFVAIAVRILAFALLVANPARAIEGDTESYREPATVLVETGSYTYPGTLRTPLYPMFIALMNLTPIDHSSAIVLAQLLLNALTIFIVYRLGLKLGFRRKEAALGAILLSLSLESVTSAFLILTETLFTFLSTLGFYYLIEYFRSRQTSALTVSGLSIGLAILCRPAGLLYPFVVFAMMLFMGEIGFGRRLINGILFLALVALPLAPWVVHNVVAHDNAAISKIQNYNLLAYNAASLVADRKGVSLEQARVELLEQAEVEHARLGEPETESSWNRLYGRMARKIILADLQRYLLLHLQYDLRNFLPGFGYAVHYLGISTGSLEGMDAVRTGRLGKLVNSYFGERIWVSVVLMLFALLLVVTYLGSLSGLQHLKARQGWFLTLVLVLTVAYHMLLPGAPSNSRFRVPAMPLIALVAGPGLLALGNRIRFVFQKGAAANRASGPDHPNG